MTDNREISASERPSETTALLAGSQEPRNTIVEEENGANSSDTENEEASIAEEPSTMKLSLILSSVYLGVFLAAMDSTIVATLSAPISSSFNSMSLLPWLASGYLIANAGLQPISGKLTDIYGRRTGLVWANIFFAAGNLICGLAQDQKVMILGRVVAGMGGGCLNTISTFITTDLVPLRRRGIWQGVGNICFGVGSSVGGLFGGWINDTFNWRRAFLIQVPLTIISCLVVIFTVEIPVKETDRSRVKRVDFLGAFTLVVSLVLLLLGLNSGGNIVPWNHPLVYVSLPMAGIILVAFVFIEARIAKEPIIPVRLLLKRTVASGCLTNWFAAMAYFSYIFYGPIYFVTAKGMSSTQAGLRLIPNAIGLAIGSMLSGVVMRNTGKYYILNMVVEAFFVLAASLMLPFFNLDTPQWPAFIIFFLGGIGYGGMLTVTLLALISAVDHEQQAVITSASYAARSTGSTIGIALASAVFQNILVPRLNEELSGEKDGPKLIKHLLENIKAIKELPPALEVKALRAYMDALDGVWIITISLAVAAALVSLFMRQHVLFSSLDRK